MYGITSRGRPCLRFYNVNLNSFTDSAVLETLPKQRGPDEILFRASNSLVVIVQESLSQFMPSYRQRDFNLLTKSAMVHYFALHSNTPLNSPHNYSGTWKKCYHKWSWLIGHSFRASQECVWWIVIELEFQIWLIWNSSRTIEWCKLINSTPYSGQQQQQQQQQLLQ